MQHEQAGADSAGEKDRPGPADGDPVVDWFGLTESNLPSLTAVPAAPEREELPMPTLSSLGGLRP
jgi:hypothetical protein